MESAYVNAKPKRFYHEGGKKTEGMLRAEKSLDNILHPFCDALIRGGFLTGQVVYLVNSSIARWVEYE